jgi:hypothetical protein
MADRETKRDLGAAHNAPVTPDPASTANPDPVERGHLRDQIDSGKFRDKVAAPDPAASPLGTDDEAAGAPTPAASVRYQSPSAPAYAPEGSHSKNTPPTRQGHMIAVAIVAVCVLIGVFILLSYS